jgi:predicted ATPase/signal transduction histidine kinase
MGPFIDDYVVMETLYSSSRSVVSRAYRVSDRLCVVLKQPAPGVPENLARARFAHEVAMRRGLDGERVVQLLEHSELRLVMEDLGGCSLQRFLQEQRPDLDSALQLACALTEALASLHQAGVLHGDVHPGNFIYHPQSGRLLISDFDLALRIDSGAQLADSMVQGNLAYLSPERTGRLHATVGFPADLYSLGVTLYRLFSGRLPFEGEDPLQLVHSHLALEATPLHLLEPCVPEMVSRVVERLLRKEPGQRYQTAVGLLQDLHRCRQSSEPFPLGQGDRSDQFRLPSQLYGRQAQAEQLSAVLEQAGQAGCQVVLVTGPSGVGKSSLVRSSARAARGRFLSGKFDQLRSEVPCSALMEALEGLSDQLLTEHEERLQEWQTRLQERLQNGLALVTEHVPGLERLVGAQPAPPSIEPSAAQGRFLATFQQLIQTFASRQEPLLLFLDDLQWADALTVHLLVQLATSAESQGLVLVLSYRDQELSPVHPFRRALGQFPEPVRVELEPLALSEVEQLLGDCLGGRDDELCQLARVITDKTEGNPFFVRQFLQTLHSEGLLRYCPKSTAFVYDLEQVRAAPITDNVAELLARNLEGLPPETNRLLRLAAALGNRFSLSTLQEFSEGDLESGLKPALQMGLVLTAAGREPNYRFQHDRVQQAAYEALPVELRPELHAEIGRMLLGRLSAEQLEERLLEVVGHLNRARCLPGERADWAALAMRAGEKARAAAAYELACGCYRSAVDWQDWAEDPELAYQAHVQWAESLRLSGALCQSLEILERASPRIADVERLARLECLRMSLHQSRGELELALESIRRAATLLGLELPADPSPAIEAAVESVLDWAAGGPLERLLELPELQDSHLKTLMEVLSSSAPIAFQAEPALGTLITLRQATVSLTHGNSFHSARAYCGLYRTLEWRGQAKLGYRFARLGLELNRRRGENGARAGLNFLYGYFIGPWNQPWSRVLDAFRHSWEAGLNSGDYQHMGYSGIFEIFAALLGGPALPQIAAQTENSLRTCRQLGEHVKADFLNGLLVLVRQLSGRQSWEPVAESGEPAGAIMKVSQGCIELLRGYYSENSQAVEAALAAMRPLLPGTRGYLTEAVYYLYGGLAAAARGDLQELEVAWQWMSARRCRANFAAPTCLLEAEVYRLRRRPLKAARRYDRAIALAGKHRLPGLEALANHLAGQFWLERSQSAFAGLYLRAAHRLYGYWGAGALAGQLELRHGSLVQRQSEGSSSSQTSDLLDYASLARAAQAISGEIVLERLLTTLTELLIENAGAQTGALILASQGDWEIRALRALENGPVEVVELPLAQARLARGVVQYALRTGQKVTLGDARQDARFGQDEYIRRQAPRSLLCAPLAHKGRLLGALYLENNLLVDAFSEGRLSGLDILLAQVGVSLENARLFARERQQAEELEELVSHRTRELRQANESLRQESCHRERMENELRLGQKLQAVGQLAAGVAHEINTPMQYIQDNLTFVREVSERWQGLDEDSAEVPEALEAALEGVRRVTAIVRAMKAFSYPDQSEKSMVDLNQAIENTLLVARNEYKLVADVSTEFAILPPLLCFAGELNQVVLNLVVNAAHAIEETGRRGNIRVVTRLLEGQVAIEVGDDGGGIPEAVQARIFDPFFTTKDVGKGTGQGLAIARSAVERQGGRLSFVSQLGLGTTFTVLLPLQA